MEIYDAIKNFSSQFLFEPIIENEDRLITATKFIVAGMGGSHLAADLMRTWNPATNIMIWHDYGAPQFAEEELRQHLVIISSYSGNTEETLDVYHSARERGIPVAAIAAGGTLLDNARRDRIPVVALPTDKIQPRIALGVSFKALLALVREPEALEKIRELATTLQSSGYEEEGRALAQRLRDKIPVIYTSARNASLGYSWKIKFNETSKIPAFCNTFPELNHNEMTGFDRSLSTSPLSEKMHLIMLKDRDDPPRIKRRMDMTAALLKERGLSTEDVELEGESVFYKIFSSLILADWASYYTAMNYRVEPGAVPLVEEFKKRIAS